MTKPIYEITSTTIKFDMPDNNNRVWPKVVIEKSVNEFNSRVPVLCTMADPETADELPDLERVSHSVIGVEATQQGITASIQVLDTPMGTILKQLLDEETLEVEALVAYVGIVNHDRTVDSAQIINIGVKTRADKKEDLTDEILSWMSGGK